MGLLQSLEIEAYRGFRDVRFEDFGDVTLIVGPSNTGKSSVIEAVGLVCRPVDPGQWVQTAVHRDVSAPLVDGLWGLFPGAQALTIEQGGQASRPLVVKAALSEGARVLHAEAHALMEAWAEPEISGDEVRIDATVRLQAHVTGAGGEARSEMDFASSQERRPPVTTGSSPCSASSW